MTISSSTKYIDTGISWIGTIPSDWQMVSLKSIAWVILGKMRQDKPASKEDTLEKYLCAKDVHLDGINWYEPKEMYFSPKEKRALLVKDGDLLIVEGGAGAGGAYVAKNPTTENFYVQNSINIVRAHKCVLPQYLYYWVNKLVTNGYVEVACNVATIPHFTKEKVSSIQIPLPSLDVQQRIVSYLDSHILSIDKRMSLLETKRNLYLRLKTAIINRVVTQGLNPDVKMKDSGVEWISMIPEHWEITRILETARRSITAFIDGDWIETPDIADEGIRYITSGNVGALTYKEQGAGFISEETFEALHCTEVFPGDLLISRLNPPIGRTCIVPDLGTRIVTCVDNVIYRPNLNKFDKQFLVYLMNCQYYSDYVTNLGRGATMKRVSRSQLAKIKIIVPPLTEQHAISTYLDEKCAKIDAIIENLNQQIDKHKLLKRALINEVITGQRAV